MKYVVQRYVGDPLHVETSEFEGADTSAIPTIVLAEAHLVVEYGDGKARRLVKWTDSV